MKNIKQKLLIEQTDKKLAVFIPISSNVITSKGWVNTVRTSLKMSLRQLGNRLKISSQSVKELEVREANGTITLNSLKDAANALDLKLVYGFVSKHGSIDQMIEQRAKELATEGIRVNAVRPGLIYTDIHASAGDPGRVDRVKTGVPMQRGGTAEEVAEAILWLASEHSSYVTGTLLDVTGGR